jgi:hypothetical protein
MSRNVCFRAFIYLMFGCLGHGKRPGQSFGPIGPPMYWCIAQNRSDEKLVPDMNKSGSLWLIRLPCLGLCVPGPLYTSCKGCLGRGKQPEHSFGPKGPPMYWCHAQNRSGEKLAPDINKSGSLWLIRLPCLGLYVPGPLYTSCLGAWAVGRSQGTPLDQKDRQCTGNNFNVFLTYKE